MRKLDEKYIQKLKATKYLAIARSENLSPGQVIDRDENPVLFRNVIRAGGEWSLPGTVFEIPNAGLEVVETVEYGAPVEVYVSVDGSDSGDGTKESPFASIQYAIDYMVGSFGHEASKKVVLLKGSYNIQDTIHIYSPNISITSANGPHRTNFICNFEKPAIFVSNLSYESQKDFLNDGGVSYDTSGEYVSYTGAVVTGREVPDFWEDFSIQNNTTTYINFTISGIFIIRDAFSGPIVFGLGAPLREDYGVYLADIYLENCYTYQLNNLAKPSLAFKNCLEVRARNSTLCVTNQMVIFDNTRLVFLSNDSKNTDLSPPGVFVFSGQDSVPSIEGKPSKASDLIAGSFGAMESSVITHTVGAVAGKLYSTNGSSSGLVNKDVDTDRDLIVKFGGTISGNLTVRAGANIDLTGVTVLGNVDLTNAGTVTWRGGSFYGTLTDPDAKLGGATAGSYLNVSA